MASIVRRGGGLQEVLQGSKGDVLTTRDVAFTYSDPEAVALILDGTNRFEAGDDPTQALVEAEQVRRDAAEAGRVAAEQQAILDAQAAAEAPAESPEEVA